MLNILFDSPVQATLNLARPEFEGLWDKETKPYRIPKDDHHSAKPVGGSKMDQVCCFSNAWQWNI